MLCPGCGLCEQRCPVSDPAPAIVVVPTGAQEETYVARRNGGGLSRYARAGRYGAVDAEREEQHGTDSTHLR